MTYHFKSFYIPDRMMGGLTRYIQNGIRPGAFLCAVLSNDLRSTVDLADDENQHNIPAYSAWLYNHAPISCYGSPEDMEAWIERKWEERNVLVQENGHDSGTPGAGK